MEEDVILVIALQMCCDSLKRYARSIVKVNTKDKTAHMPKLGCGEWCKITHCPWCGKKITFTEELSKK